MEEIHTYNLITICICTYKRPHLKETLQSIEQQIISSEYNLEIVVADNDPGMFGKPICDEFMLQSKYRVVYVNEPTRNLSVVRNASIAEANGELIALIDDDEVADANWLQNLIVTMNTYNADVVFGWVKALYPEHTPRWLEQARAFDVTRHSEGFVVTSGASNATLIKRTFLVNHNLQFSLDYGSTGGEDADLFFRMHMLGALLVCSNNAFVSEMVADSRMTKSYLENKAIRIGECYTNYRIGHMSKTEKLLYLFKNLVKLTLCSISATALSIFSKPEHIIWKLRMLDSYGKIRAIWSDNSIEMYK